MCVHPFVTFYLSPWDKHFPHTGGTNIFTHGGTNIFVGGDGDGYDVDGHKEEEDVSEASKLSARATILKGP